MSGREESKASLKCVAEQVGGLSSVSEIGKSVEQVEEEEVKKEGQELSFKFQYETFIGKIGGILSRQWDIRVYSSEKPS